MKLFVLLGCSATLLFGQDPGQKLFETTCGRCHGADGAGGEMGPAIVTRIGSRDEAQLADLIHKGLPGRGMPPSNVSAEEMPVLTRFLRRLAR
ncbi:MAG TPA: cytochrome c, partial [Tepidisphaeraceae bacterium]|nr:cytochrome c [Tepidisphaeraceae bacterium]